MNQTVDTLPPHRFYYLHNFQQALAWLQARYADVLDAQAQRFMQDFAAAPQPAQALMVRLLMRRGPWFRADQLQYDEIADIAAAAQPWLATGWFDAQAPLPVAALFALHTRSELQQCLPAALLASGKRKQDWLTAAMAQAADAQTEPDWRPLACAPVWLVRAAEVAQRLRLMFFGNLHQDWSTFVLTDLGVYQYESVPLAASSRAFQSGEDVNTYLALQACREQLDAGVATSELLAALQTCRSANPWLEARRAKVLLRIGQACERAADWPQALAVYAQCAYPGARYRRLRVLERTGQYAAAHALAATVCEAPESEEERQRVLRMLPRLRRALGLAAQPRAALLPIARTDLRLPYPGAGQRVEALVCEQLRSAQTRVFYVENQLVLSVFGLLCWPAIFAPLPGAFFHPFQRAPADVDAPDFVRRRQAQFDACLSLLDDDRYQAAVRQTYASKQGLQSPFVTWEGFSPDLLDLALALIPAAHWRHLFTRLLQDLRQNRAGLPDLICFWPQARRYEMIEVKGPGDRLQDNQVRWLQYCRQADLPVRVCYVQWAEPEAARLCP